MATPSANEQYLLELTNRARLDPRGEFDRLITFAPTNVLQAVRYFDVDMGLLKQQFDALTAVAPLTWNEQLASAAYGHTVAMIIHDEQSHQLPGEASLGQRLVNAGYNYRSGGENVFAFTEDPFYGHAGFFIDWGNTATGIQDPAGHRINIMSATFTEVGMSYIAESSPATSVGPYVVTQNFGTRSGYVPQFTGVVISDADGDHFYDPGEGVGGIGVKAVGAAGTYTTTTWSSGGYNLAAPAGSYQITFSYGSRSWTTNATINGQNVKVDADYANIKPIPSNGTHDSLFDVSRFYNTQTGTHFYTGSDAERDQLIGTGGVYVYEGNGFDSNATASTGIGVYRFYNEKTGVHFYTASAAERASVNASLPQFHDEGLAYYAYADAGTGRQALYRFYNTQTGTHFYTASDSEMQDVQAKLPQFHYEGVAYYVEIA